MSGVTNLGSYSIENFEVSACSPRRIMFFLLATCMYTYIFISQRKARIVNIMVNAVVLSTLAEHRTRFAILLPMVNLILGLA